MGSWSMRKWRMLSGLSVEPSVGENAYSALGLHRATSLASNLAAVSAPMKS